MNTIRYRLTLTAVLFTIVALSGFVSNAFAVPKVTLTVLNAPNEYGDVVIVSGSSVEVELMVIDTLNETSSSDVIRLIGVVDGAIANEQKRGKELSGSRSLGTQKTNGSDILGELQVQYVDAATGKVIATADKSIFLVDNKALVELTKRTSAVEEKAVLTEKKALEVDLKAEETKTKMAIIEPKVSEVEKKVLVADTKAEETKVKMAVMEPKVIEVEKKVIDADTKATDAKTKADSAELKVLAVETKVLNVETKADTALAENVTLKNQVNNITAQSCPSGEYVSGFDADGNIICYPVSGAPAPAPVLLAYYPFEGNVSDLSGNGYNGTVGGTELYDAGYTGQAFSFNRATYISTLLDIDASVQPQLTMGAWVRPSGAFYGQVMTHDDQGFDRSLIYYNGDWRAYDGRDGGSVHTGFLPATGDWQFLAVVYDQDRQTVMVYVDGITVIKAGQLLGPSVNMFRIANNESNGAEFFSGLIDEVFVVSGALNVNELDEIRINGIRSLFP